MWEFEQIEGSEVLMILFFTPLINVKPPERVKPTESASPLNELPPIQMALAGLYRWVGWKRRERHGFWNSRVFVRLTCIPPAP